MSENSASFNDGVKIPWPKEGVIRTAALDDTIAPEDSVQIGVNVNFDQVGAIKTRKGLTKYADDLSGAIKNFGKLVNNTVPDGYKTLLKLSPNDVFDSTFAEYITSTRIDDTHFILFWSATGNIGKAQVVEADLSTGVITLKGSPLTFDATNALYNSTAQVDANHFINFWANSTASKGYVQVFTVNLSTWAVTAEGTKLAFDATAGFDNSCAKISSTKFINFWGNASIGLAQVFTVNLGTWAVTAESTPLTFDAGLVSYNSCQSLGDGTHIINFWADATGLGQARVFAMNGGTFAVTTAGAKLNFDATAGRFNSSASLGDGQHFVNFWQGTSFLGYCQDFEVNLSTFAITAKGSVLNFDTNIIVRNSAISMGDGQHFVNFWRSASSTGLAQIFSVNLSTFVLSSIATPISFGAMKSSAYISGVLSSNYRVLVFRNLADSSGVGSVFHSQGTPVTNHYLYAQQANGDVLNWDNPGWTTRRSGLQTLGKARFTQFLSRIWMVNGNATIGDAVQTSNGGAFDTTLVPTGFPPGDFIQAGFEGRVWVADKLYGVLYFTDIVQFTPPNTFTLTYDPETNFIENFSPQNGQSITGLYVTPRALLLFQENNIYRIYGAFSVDSYPAYNVGTYSQESIVETKDGLYFHHSSGLYKFAYDGQPVEISRRIIDFIQAIPRAYYPEVKGIYDGFDAIEWYVGPVTVEGVTYSNCVLRYTISTQVWTIYDYPGNDVTAFISYDDGSQLNMIMGTQLSKVSKMESGFDDLGNSFYFEMIDRLRSYTNLYAKSKSISGMNIYSDNGAGTLVQFQDQKSPTNDWGEALGTLDENYCSLLPNASTDDFNVGRIRLSGNTNGTPVVIHGMELLSINDKGFNQN